MTDLPVACALSPVDLVKRRELLVRELLALVEQTIPMEEGYRLKFPNKDSVLSAIAQMIQVERECCPFLRFELVIEAGHGPVWLSLSGPPGTRVFLEQELRL